MRTFLSRVPIRSVGRQNPAGGDFRIPDRNARRSLIARHESEPFSRAPFPGGLWQHGGPNAGALAGMRARSCTRDLLSAKRNVRRRGGGGAGGWAWILYLGSEE